nr:ADP,ATP carrier protein [Ipomoea batatas]
MRIHGSFGREREKSLGRKNSKERYKGKAMNMEAKTPRSHAILSWFVTVHPHETSALISSASTFFFILSAYFVVLPLRDDGAMSLGLENLPGLFVGSLVLTLVAAPLSTLIFTLPNLSKAKALALLHRFFAISLFLFFTLWVSSTPGSSIFHLKGFLSMSTIKEELKVNVDEANPSSLAGWGNHGWFYISVRIGFFLWVALLNLVTISSTWARVIDVMDSESGSRLFGFIGAGATLGQLVGSLFATGMAWLGPYLLLVAAILMELASQSSKGINKDISHLPEEQTPIRLDDTDHANQTEPPPKNSSPRLSSTAKPQLWAILDGIRLILSSTYLQYVALFLWLGAVISSFFYFQKVTVIAKTVTNPVGRRRLLAEINSFIAVFILIGQLTLTGRILTVAGITLAICSSPFVACINLITLAIWPTWVQVAISETLRKVVNYVVTRPGRELLFTVVSQEEKYKAKVCIDVIVQRLGDATAAGMYKLLFSTLNGKVSTVSLYALPVCFLWIMTAFHLGRRQKQLSRLQSFAAVVEMAGN